MPREVERGNNEHYVEVAGGDDVGWGGSAVNAEKKDGGEFWKTPQQAVAWEKLSAAKVKLVSEPDERIPYAMFTDGKTTSPRDFVATAPEAAPYQSVESGEVAGYQVVKKGLDLGAAPHSDRTYKIESLPPELAGLTLLRTRMGQKGIVDSRFSIVLTPKQPCYLFVAVDERAINTYKKFGAPAWMKDLSPTGLRIVTDDPLMKQTKSGYTVFVQSVADEEIVLGAACCDPLWNAMYFAFFGRIK